MKKILLLLIPILFLTGCDSKTEEFTKICTKKEESLNMSDIIKEKITYNNKDEVVSVVVTRTYKAKNDDGLLLIKDLQNSALNYNNNLVKSGAIKIKNITDKEDEYIIKYYLAVQKLNRNALKEFGLNKNSIKLFNKKKKDNIECK